MVNEYFIDSNGTEWVQVSRPHAEKILNIGGKIAKRPSIVHTLYDKPSIVNKEDLNNKFPDIPLKEQLKNLVSEERSRCGKYYIGLQWFTPCIVVPRYYDTQKATLTLKKDKIKREGVTFKLCEKPTPEQIETLTNLGCSFFHTQAQYAPEMIKPNLFVPNVLPTTFE